jgi:hypothetical protein
MQSQTGGHIIPAEQKSYNERLFKKGIRKYFHEARFYWLKKVLGQLKINSGEVIELGCHDGKLIRYLPFTPSIYTGYDANWENGIDLAKEEWKHHLEFHFHVCSDPAQFNPGLKKYELGVCMETMEHLPAADLAAYISKLRQSVSQYLFITVPNEKGPVFLLKYVMKRLFLKVDEPYTWRELLAASVGKTEKVERNEYGHKGFDYEKLLPFIAADFTIVSISPIPFSFLPAWMNFSVGIIAQPK